MKISTSLILTMLAAFALPTFCNEPEEKPLTLQIYMVQDSVMPEIISDFIEHAELKGNDEILVLGRWSKYNPYMSFKLQQKRADYVRDMIKEFVAPAIKIIAWGQNEKGWIVKEPQTAVDSMLNNLTDIQIIRAVDYESPNSTSTHDTNN